MALKGIRVIELAGLAPAPFCGMILSDFGAKVIRIDKTSQMMFTDVLGRGKQSVAVNLKKKEGVDVVQRLCKNADVLIEPFRKGIMEKLGLGPEKLLCDNPHLIYARLTGYGQNGPLAKKAGHDINYIAISGILSALGKGKEAPVPPINILADFAGGGLTCALGIVMALFERTTSGRGQVIDANMVEGSAYVGSFLWKTKVLPGMWDKEKGQNLLDGGVAFYRAYRTLDDKFMSVGALEPQFFEDLLKGLGLSPDDIGQNDDQEKMAEKFNTIFLTKTRDEWTKIFQDGDLDACVFPILEMDEAPKHPHNAINKSYMESPNGDYEPIPAPKLSRTPGVSTVLPNPAIGQDTRTVLSETGFSQSEIDKLLESGVIKQSTQSRM